MTGAWILVVVHLAIEVVLILRVLLRPHRDPASRIAWIAVIAAVPLVGIVAYILLGNVNIGRRQIAKMRRVMERMPPIAESEFAEHTQSGGDAVERYQHLFHVGHSISGFAPVGGNSAELLRDSNATIDAMVADMDAAKDHVHLLFYIWLPDTNGVKVVEALQRAARRGVKCRALVDNLGSRGMIDSQHWRAMQEAGVHLAVALPIGNPFVRALKGRIDLRNHRKIVIIDGMITYCGSQNCADPEFRVKAKYAPWVDAVMRFEGPIARQNQYLFAGDWMAFTDEDIDELLRLPTHQPTTGFPAQVVGTGPTVRFSAMPEMFESLIYTARRELVVTTPYYVPNESMQSAFCACGYRGVDTTLIVPARNDSWIVGGASRSYYADLLEAGVKIYEYIGGLLHTKSLTMDGDVTFIGSANMDRRSFDLNYENNILLCDRRLTAAMRDRQQDYISKSNLVTRESVTAWPTSRRLWNNTLALLGPVL